MKQSENSMKLHKEFAKDILTPKRTCDTAISAIDSRISGALPRLIVTTLTYAPAMGETLVHYDDTFEIFYQPSASDGCEYLLGDKIMKIKPGEFALVPMGLRHRPQRCEAGTRGYIFGFQKDFADCESMKIFFDCAYLHPWLHAGDRAKQVFTTTAESRRMTDSMAEELKRCFEDVNTAEMRKDSRMLEEKSALLSASFKRFVGLLGRMFYSRCTPREIELFEKYRPPMLAAINYIEEHFADKPRLEDICGAAGYRVAWFSKLFREIMGLTAVEYLNFVRIRRGRFLLVNTLIPIHEVAQMCGYNSIHHFDRAFKAQTGCTPKVYRTEYIIESQVEK